MDDDVIGGGGGGYDGSSINDDDVEGAKANANNAGSENVSRSGDTDVNDDDDDDAVNQIVNHTNTSISSISNSSVSSTGKSTDILPTEYYDGYFDAALSPNLLHKYGSISTFQKVYFNVFKGKLSSNENVNIKVQDYIIFRKCQSAKTRFAFAGILCKHSHFYTFCNNEENKLTSKILV